MSKEKLPKMSLALRQTKRLPGAMKMAKDLIADAAVYLDAASDELKNEGMRRENPVMLRHNAVRRLKAAVELLES